MTVVYIPHTTIRQVPGRGGSVAGAVPTPELRVRDAEGLKLTPSAAEQIAKDLWERYAKRIQKLGASVVEVRFKTRGWQSLGPVQGEPHCVMQGDTELSYMSLYVCTMITT